MLARRRDREGLRYSRQADCFPRIQDPQRAQSLLDEQLQVNWTACLQPFADRLNPLHAEMFRNYSTGPASNANGPAM